MPTASTTAAVWRSRAILTGDGSRHAGRIRSARGCGRVSCWRRRARRSHRGTRGTGRRGRLVDSAVPAASTAAAVGRSRAVFAGNGAGRAPCRCRRVSWRCCRCRRRCRSSCGASASRCRLVDSAMPAACATAAVRRASPIFARDRSGRIGGGAQGRKRQQRGGCQRAVNQGVQFADSHRRTSTENIESVVIFAPRTNALCVSRAETFAPESRVRC